MEPQSAVANAIMFDRTTGISCEECLTRCMGKQAQTTQWVCRTLSYDNRWRICDLFAINGTSYPHFLTEYPGRDYFVYLQARAPTAAELSGDTEENVRGNTIPQTSVSVYGAPSGGNAQAVVETKSEYEATDLKSYDSQNSAVYGSASEDSDSGYKDSASDTYSSQTSASAPGESYAATASKSLSSSSTQALTSSHKTTKLLKSSSKTAKSQLETTISNSESYAATSDSQLKQSQTGASDYQAQAVLSNAVSRSGDSGLCQEGDTTRYAAIKGKERINPGTETHFVDNNTPEQCADACDSDELFTCASSVLTSSGCELSTTGANHAHAGELIAAPNSTYLEKLCLPSTLAKGTEKIWPVVDNYILVGHVLEVADAATFTECVVACLRAEEEFGFVCKSAMWYPVDDDQNCLLNSESRATQPHVFVAEDQGVQMLYFDVPRDESFVDSNMTPIRLRDDPLNDEKPSQYTYWSPCGNNSTTMRHRYLKCQHHKDIRKCPKESVTCRHLPVKSLKFECVAVRDSLGRKRCPHGIRTLPDGQKEYCKQPIDCV
ncbi:unnamed protein product [Toxocara canis]|nr:unnamed protein product [Toxocara canis]